MRITDSSNKGNGLLAKNDHFNLPTRKVCMIKLLGEQSHMYNMFFLPAELGEEAGNEVLSH